MPYLSPIIPGRGAFGDIPGARYSSGRAWIVGTGSCGTGTNWGHVMTLSEVLYWWALGAVPLWAIARVSLDRSRRGGRERFTRCHDRRLR